MVTTGIKVLEPVVPAVATPDTRSITGVVPPVLVMRPVVPLTLVTVPLPLLLNVFQSVDVRYPLTEVVAAAILIDGVEPPEDTTGAVPVTLVTVPEPLLLKVFQSVDVKYPLTDDVAAAMLIAGVFPPLDTTGAVPVTLVTVPVLFVYPFGLLAG